MPVRRAFRRIVALALLSVLLAVPLGGLANMANPVQPGEPVGEPAAALRGLRIVHEHLRLDLRPLVDTSLAVVEATYQVQVDGLEREVDLMFVPGSMMGAETGVWLDEQPIPSTRSEADVLPDAWQPPLATPHPAGGPPLSYETDWYGAGGGVLRFGVVLAPGMRTLRVRYQARPGEYADPGEPTKFWQLGYVLAPARHWDGFGRLDVEVLLPEGWRAASDPVLARQGNALTGTFTELPSDALALTAQAPPPASDSVHALLTWIGGVLGLLLGGWLSSRMGRWLGRRRRTSAWALPLTFVLGALWSLGLLATTSILLDAGREALDHQASWTYGYSTPLLMVLGLPFFLLIALVVFQSAAFLARRRSARLQVAD